MDIYEIRKANLIALIGDQVKRKCAERWDMAPAHLSQVLSDKTRKNLGDDVARRIEEREGLPRAWLDTLRNDAENIAWQKDPKDARQVGEAPSSYNYVLIPHYDARAACGDGYLNDHIEVNGGLAFRRDWIKALGCKADDLCVIHAQGESMQPYIFEGDIVLIDTSSTEPRDRHVYALRRPDGEISIKRLVQQISGSWVIRSDNPDKSAYPDEPVTAEVLHEIPILGRVIWRGGGVG